MICQQCGTENGNKSDICMKCGRPLRSEDVKGVVTCKNHGNRASVAICYQCLRPICEECTVTRGIRTFCVEDALVDVAGEEEERIEQLSVGDPSFTLHAGFTSRLISFLIDSAVLLILAVLLASIFWLVTGVQPSGIAVFRTEHTLFALYWTIFLIIVFAYFVVLVASEGQTFGKQAMRIAVVEEDGTTPSISTASRRWLFSLVSLVCLGAGCFAVITDPDRQAWHDHWANTYVISLDEATERL